MSVFLEDASKHLETLQAVRVLCDANFPRTTQVRIATQGVDPSAHVNVPSWFLLFLCEIAEEELQKRRKAEREQSDE